MLGFKLHLSLTENTYIPSEKILKAPLSVRIEITRECNCSCLHCCNESGEPLPNELSKGEFIRIIDELWEAGVFAVGFTGGEPFLKPWFIKILTHAVKRDFLISVSTNGSIMNDNVAEFLADNNIDVEVSLDFASPKEHDWFRRHPGLWEKVMSTLRALTKYNANVSVSMVLTRLNTSDVERLARLLKDFPVSLNIADVLPFGRAAKNWNLLSLDMTYIKNNLLPRVKELQRFIDGFLKINCNISFDFMFKEDGPSRACPGGTFIGAIRSDGLLKPCPYFPPSTNDSLRLYDFEKIWKESPLLNKFRQGWVIEECTSCPFWLKKCVGGCRAISYIHKGDFYAPNDCPLLCRK